MKRGGEGGGVCGWGGGELWSLLSLANGGYELGGDATPTSSFWLMLSASASCMVCLTSSLSHSLPVCNSNTYALCTVSTASQDQPCVLCAQF